MPIIYLKMVQQNVNKVNIKYEQCFNLGYMGLIILFFTPLYN